MRSTLPAVASRMHIHTISLKLVCVSLLCLLQYIHVAADYRFEVDIRSYSNPSNRASNGDCCDIDFFSCGSCDTYLDSFCLRSAGHSRSESTTCPLGSSDSRITSLPATVAITGTEPWPGNFQLYIRVQDEDLVFDDLIDRIFPESNIGPSSTFSDTMSFTGDSGRATLGLRFRVTCRQDYYGADCDTFCRPRNDSEGHYTCDGNGNVVCLDGYTEPSINCIIPVCMEGCHPDGGFCEIPGQCMCEECWSGSLCNQCTTDQGCGTCMTVCSSSPCENGGTCLLVGIDDYTCICPMGFEGDNCENVTNECASNPCHNGGTCRDEMGSYSCICAPDFTDQNCEINIDDCEGVLCQENSVCVDEIDSFECVCNPGFKGPNCTRIPEGNACDFFPCANGSTCMESGSNYVCVCASGFTGENCTTNINDCEGVTCPGNSSCMDGVSSFRCVCNLGYTGAQCDINIDDCERASCPGNSSCVDGVGSFRCVCNLGYTGAQCDINIDDCERASCPGNSSCVDGVGSFRCVCNLGYTGAQCDINIDDCERASCPGNSACVDGVGLYQCVCNLGYSGSQCEETEGSGEAGEGRGSQESPKDAIIAGAVVGGIVLLIFLLLVLLVVILLIRKRSRKLDLSHQRLDRSGSPNVSGYILYNSSSPIKSDFEMKHPSPNDNHDPPALEPMDNPIYRDPNAGFSTMIPDVPSSGDSGTLHRLDNPLYGDDLRGTESGAAIYSEPDQSGVAIYSEPDQSGTAIYSEPASLVQHGDEPYAYAYTRKHDMGNTQAVPNPAYACGPGDSTDTEYHKLDHGTLKEKPQGPATAEGTTYDALQF